MMPEGDRQSGRTTRALKGLPDGAIYLVAHKPEVDYCRGLLTQVGRDWNAIRFVTLAELPGALMGLPRSTILDVDHFVFEIASFEQRDLIRTFMHRYRLPPAEPKQNEAGPRVEPGVTGEDDAPGVTGTSASFVVWDELARIGESAPAEGPQGRTAARSGPGAAGAGNSREEGCPEGPPHARDI